MRDLPAAQPEPDAAFGRRVRLICGSLLGIVFALWLHLYVGPFHLLSAMTVALISTGACGLLAMRYGDAFWHAVISFLRA